MKSMNSDLYQLNAYITRCKLSCGLLIYVDDEINFTENKEKLIKYPDLKLKNTSKKNFFQ